MQTGQKVALTLTCYCEEMFLQPVEILAVKCLHINYTGNIFRPFHFFLLPVKFSSFHVTEHKLFQWMTPYLKKTFIQTLLFPLSLSGLQGSWSQSWRTRGLIYIKCVQYFQTNVHQDISLNTCSLCHMYSTCTCRWIFSEILIPHFQNDPPEQWSAGLINYPIWLIKFCRFNRNLLRWPNISLVKMCVV